MLIVSSLIQFLLFSSNGYWPPCFGKIFFVGGISRTPGTFSVLEFMTFSTDPFKSSSNAAASIEVAWSATTDYQQLVNLYVFWSLLQLYKSHCLNILVALMLFSFSIFIISSFVIYSSTYFMRSSLLPECIYGMVSLLLLRSFSYPEVLFAVQVHPDADLGVCCLFFSLSIFHLFFFSFSVMGAILLVCVWDVTGRAWSVFFLFIIIKFS